jgi:hypothetical protein
MRIRRGASRAPEGSSSAGNRQQEKTLLQNIVIFRVHGYRYLPQEMKINYNTEQKAFGGSLEPELDGVTAQALGTVYKIHLPIARTQNNRCIAVKK